MNVFGRQKTIQVILAYAVAIVFAVVLLFPLGWVILTSIKPPALTFTIPPAWQFTPTFENYTAVLARPGLLKAATNTLIVSISATLLNLTVGTLAAYSMARYRAGGMPLLFITLAVRTMPAVVLGLPFFILFMNLRLVDTLQGLVLAYTAFMLPNTIWLLLAFFADIPKEMEEAALVDGSTRFQAFWKVVLPLARPGLIVTGIYSLMWAWNHFFFGLILSARNATTLPVVAAQFVGEYAIRWGEVSAISTIIILPPIIAVFLLQGRLAKGLMLGGVKG
jgi:multiple sugar transport system permease protein